MKLILSFLIAILALHNPSSTFAQETPANTGTQVTSDSFRLDLGQKEGIFLGNVRVVDEAFVLESEEMTVFFGPQNEVLRMVARGNVRIEQGDTRKTTSREAEYIVADKKLVLKGEPVVFEGTTRITGTIINIYPDEDRMEVEGRSRVNLILE